MAPTLEAIAVRSTRCAELSLLEGGIVQVRVKRDPPQRVEDAHENLRAARELAAGKRLPILVDITHTRPLEAEVRHVYRREGLRESFSALALVVAANPLGLMLGNVYLGVTKPDIPAQLFRHPEAALEWLRRITK